MMTRKTLQYERRLRRFRSLSSLSLSLSLTSPAPKKKHWKSGYSNEEKRQKRQTEEALAANEEKNGTEELTGALTGCHKYSNE